MTLEEAIRRTVQNLASTLAAFATITVVPGDQPTITIVPTAAGLMLISLLGSARREQKKRETEDESPAS